MQQQTMDKLDVLIAAVDDAERKVDRARLAESYAKCDMTQLRVKFYDINDPTNNISDREQLVRVKKYEAAVAARRKAAACLQVHEIALFEAVWGPIPPIKMRKVQKPSDQAPMV